MGRPLLDPRTAGPVATSGVFRLVPAEERGPAESPPAPFGAALVADVRAFFAAPGVGRDFGVGSFGVRGISVLRERAGLALRKT